MRSEKRQTTAGRGGKCREVEPATDAPSGGHEPGSFAALYRAEVGFVFRVTRQLGVPDGEADDVVHEVFLIVHRRLDDFDRDRSTMRSWLYGITRRVVMHHNRARSRRGRWTALGLEPAPLPEPGDLVDRARVADLIDAFLLQLDPDKRTVFALMELEGMTAQEIAAAEGTSPNTVYSRLRAARKLFQRWLKRWRAKTRG